MIPHVPLNRRKGLENKLVGVELPQPSPWTAVLSLKALLHPLCILLDDSLPNTYLGEKQGMEWHQQICEKQHCFWIYFFAVQNPLRIGSSLRYLFILQRRNFLIMKQLKKYWGKGEAAAFHECLIFSCWLHSKLLEWLSELQKGKSFRNCQNKSNHQTFYGFLFKFQLNYISEFPEWTTDTFSNSLPILEVMWCLGKHAFSSKQAAVFQWAKYCV